MFSVEVKKNSLSFIKVTSWKWDLPNTVVLKILSCSDLLSKIMVQPAKKPKYE